MKELINYINENNLGDYEENVSFKTLTTYRTGGVASIVVCPNSVETLIKVLKYVKNNNIKHKVFGNGSNILASDEFYDGVIIRLSNLTNVTEENNIIKVEAGYSLAQLANETSKRGLTGLEFACGIPGSVGGAVYMNAGAYLKSMSDVIIDVDVLDIDYNIKTLTKEELDFSYRHSVFMDKKEYIILSTKLKFEEGNLEEILELVNNRRKRRVDSQPLEYPSAGSVFRNPEGEYAGHLIEECDLKGKVYGGAEISSKHANFIVNKDNATSTDVKYLMDLVISKVKDKYNIDLKREQELFNWE